MVQIHSFGSESMNYFNIYFSLSHFIIIFLIEKRPCQLSGTINVTVIVWWTKISQNDKIRELKEAEIIIKELLV